MNLDTTTRNEARPSTPSSPCSGDDWKRARSQRSLARAREILAACERCVGSTGSEAGRPITRSVMVRVAAELGLSHQTVANALRLARATPAVRCAVERGDLRVEQVYRTADSPEVQERKLLSGRSARVPTRGVARARLERVVEAADSGRVRLPAEVLLTLRIVLCQTHARHLPALAEALALVGGR